MLTASIDAAVSFAESERPGAEVLTIVIFGGWGGARVIDMPPRDRWRCVFVTPSDLELLTVCEDANFDDLLRLQLQRERLETLDLSILDSNGLLNLIAWWQRTGHMLIPGGDLAPA